MKDYKVVDSDGHIDPGIAVNWEKYIPAPYGSMVVKRAMESFAANGHLEGARRGGWEPGARLEDMDEEGIDVAVLFGGAGIGLSTRGSDDPGFGPAMVRGYNDWLHGYCSKDPARLKGVAPVALENMEEACKEAQRAVGELGAVGVVVPPFLGGLALDNPQFYPLYEVMESLDAPVMVHGPGDLRSFLSTVYKAHFRQHAVDFPVAIMMASMDLVCGGVMERFKKLRFAFLEGAVGWMPWWMERLDEHFEKLPYQVPVIDQKPSELVGKYMQEGRFFWSCEPDEKYLTFVLGEYGDDFIVYASDYPHWDCIFPESVRAIANREELSPAQKRMILSDNGRKLFGKRLDRA